jgi:hypothetical protein
MAPKKKSQSRKSAPRAAVRSASKSRSKMTKKAARNAGIRKAVLLATVLALFVIAFAQNSEAQNSTQNPIIKDFQTTISGILYRGGSRGANPLSEAQLQHLCEEGVGHAIYTYDTGFKKAPARTCTMKDGRPGKIEYSYFRFLDKKGIEDSMAAIHNSIVNPSAGSTFVHCWNGWHASGEIAAMALKQFCDYSNEQATEYWKENIGDKGNLPKYGRVLTRIENFQPLPSLKLSLKQQSQICPR